MVKFKNEELQKDYDSKQNRCTDYRFGLKTLKEKIDNFNPKTEIEFCREGETVEEYKQLLIECYDFFSKVVDDLQIYELQLLCHFRSLPNSLQYRFVDLVKRADYLNSEMNIFCRLPFLVD